MLIVYYLVIFACYINIYRKHTTHDTRKFYPLIRGFLQK